MIYNGFQDKQLSLLGFGTMRLPLNADGRVDEALTAEMVSYGIEHGVNYFDTAYPYHGGESEWVIGRILSRYPRELDIPMLLSTYNEVRFSPAINVAMRIEALAEERRPQSCIGCGKCAKLCPQNIDIPQAMKTFSETLAGIPSWAEICKQRDAVNKSAKA